MKGQQISPWTFLKERGQTKNQHGSPLNKANLRLPKLIKDRQIATKQQKQSRREGLHRKERSHHMKTMVLTQPEPLNSQSIFPLKKKTQPLLRVVSPLKDQMINQAEQLENLSQIKLILQFIHSSLKQEAHPPENKPSIPYLEEVRKKMISFPQSLQETPTPATIRIHDKNLQSNISAIRSILKRQYEKMHQIKAQNQKYKKLNYISALKLKLTQSIPKV